MFEACLDVWPHPPKVSLLNWDNRIVGHRHTILQLHAIVHLVLLVCAIECGNLVYRPTVNRVLGWLEELAGKPHTV